MFFFFFQAEDGIRDLTVTGVQTCALPISDLPVSVRGLTDYVNAFGRYGPPSGYGIHAVQGFFDNGGTDSVVVRVAGAGAQPANVTLKDRAAAPTNTVRITAGARGRADPGTWGNGLSVIVADHPPASSAIPAQIIGTVTEPFNLAPAVEIGRASCRERV